MITWEGETLSSTGEVDPAVTNASLLTYPYVNKHFIHHVDGSNNGLSFSLYQQQEEQLRVIGYGSRIRFGAEKRYRSSKMEYLALK